MTEKQKKILQQKAGIKVIETKRKPKETIAEICNKMIVTRVSLSEVLDR